MEIFFCVFRIFMCVEFIEFKIEFFVCVSGIVWVVDDGLILLGEFLEVFGK